MPLPLVFAAGALLGAASTKKTKKDFQAVKGRKKKNGTTGKAYIRNKPKKKSSPRFTGSTVGTC
jgi:hypothetical protein